MRNSGMIRSDAISQSNTSLVIHENSTADSNSLNSIDSKRSSSTNNRNSVSLQHYDCLLGELRCPGCSKPMYAPIKLCAGGHSICEICTIKLPNCPLCLEDFLDVRSVTLEALASKAFFTCANAGKGCSVRLPRELMKWHKERCVYKTGECFMGKVWGECDWIGCEIDWKKHCEEKHEEKICFKTDMSATWSYVTSKYNKAVQGYYIFKVFGETFNLYHIYDKNSSQTMWTLIGASKDPILNQKFSYEVEIYSPNDSSRLMLQRHACHSEKDEDILTPGRCASFLMGDIMRFMDKNKVLNYRVKIIEIPKTSELLAISNGSSMTNLPIDYKMTSIEGSNNKNIPNENIITRPVDETASETNSLNNQSLTEEDAEMDQLAHLVERKLFKRQKSSLDTMNSIDRDIASNKDLQHIFMNEFLSNNKNGVNGVTYRRANSIQKPPRQSNVDLTDFVEMKPMITKNHSEPPSLPSTPHPGESDKFNFVH